MSRSLTHTLDSQRLYEFLERYPEEWHSITGDKKTARALDRCIALHPGKIAVTDYKGYNQKCTQQIKLSL